MPAALESLERLLVSIQAENRQQPPIENWQPALSGDIDILIDADGRWFHEGTSISRQQLVVLFASILRREAEGYMLVTPVEKWRIQIVDHPFVSAGVTLREEGGVPVWVLQDNVGRQHPVCAATPLLLDQRNGQWLPYLSLARGLSVRVSRSDYYFLVERGREAGSELLLDSAGTSFLLGHSDPL